jgi:hypothetical protein
MCPHDPLMYKCCGICGKSGHLQKDYNSGHCGHPHSSIPYDCPPRCFNCFFTKKPATGHYAFSDECPLKKNMRRYGSTPTDTTTTNRRSRQIPTASTLTKPTNPNNGLKALISAHQPAHPTNADPTHIPVTTLTPPLPTL